MAETNPHLGDGNIGEFYDLAGLEDLKDLDLSELGDLSDIDSGSISEESVATPTAQKPTPVVVGKREVMHTIPDHHLGNMAQPCKLRTTFAWTWPNWTEETIEYLKKDIVPKCAYICWGYEICPDTGTPHLQGYMRVKRQPPLKEVKTWFHLAEKNAGHVKRVSGCEKTDKYPCGAFSTDETNRIYCCKTETKCPKNGHLWHEYGRAFAGCDDNEQGARTDLSDFRDFVMEGATQRECLNNDEILKCVAKYPKLYAMLKEEASYEKAIVAEIEGFKPEVIVVCGASEVGKTRWVKETFGPRNVGRLDTGDGSNGSVWFDGLRDDHDTLLIDDFHGNIKFDYFLKLVDRYSMKVQVKGNYIWRNVKRIVITSNIVPERWYKCTQEQPTLEKALLRRIDRRVYLGPNGVHLDKPEGCATRTCEEF